MIWAQLSVPTSTGDLTIGARKPAPARAAAGVWGGPTRLGELSERARTMCDAVRRRARASARVDINLRTGATNARSPRARRRFRCGLRRGPAGTSQEHACKRARRRRPRSGRGMLSQS